MRLPDHPDPDVRLAVRLLGVPLLVLLVLIAALGWIAPLWCAP